MKKILSILITFCVLIAGFYIYKKATTPAVPASTQDMAAAQKVLAKEQAFTPDEGVTEEEFHEYLQERYSKPEAAVEYLFAIAMKEEVDLYSDAFTFEQFQKDIHENRSETNKEELIRDIMKRITREGTLTDIHIIKSMMVFEKESLRVVADLNYQGQEQPVRVNIKLKQVELEHIEHSGEHNHVKNDFYYVDSSIWDLINKIEKG